MLTEEMKYMFRKYDPIKRMIISRDHSFLNDYFSIIKGQLIDLNYFCTIPDMENDTPETFPVLDENDKVIYVPMNEVSNYKSGIIEVDYRGQEFPEAI